MPNNKIPFINLSTQFISLEKDLIEAFIKVGRSGNYILGKEVELFERNIAEYCGSSYAIGVGNGSDALFLILKALGIGVGDEVITAPNSFIATAWVIAATGAKPVFVDVDEDLNISPELLKLAINEKTKAVIPVHLAGRPAKMDEICALTKDKGIHVLEDAAQAIGAKYKNKRVGSLGIAAGFSLHPLKNLGVYGDGGIITTSDRSLANKIKILRNHGLVNRDECVIWGFNSRLDELQAAFGNVKLKHLDEWNGRCREIAAEYQRGLIGVVDLPVDADHEECVYHNFIIRTKNRNELMEFLINKGIETKIHYPIPIHLQECAKGLGYKAGDFPNAERYSREMISLPICPDLDEKDIAKIIDAVQSFYNK